MKLIIRDGVEAMISLRDPVTGDIPPTRSWFAILTWCARCRRHSTRAGSVHMTHLSDRQANELANDRAG